MKCQSCKKNDALWVWQPFGPAEDGLSFTVGGSHYRGFPVVRVCDGCKEKAQGKQEINFTYRSNLYTFCDGIVANGGDVMPTIEESKREISKDWIIHPGHFEVLDEEACIWFAYVSPIGKPDVSYPMIVRGLGEFVRLTPTALEKLVL